MHNKALPSRAKIITDELIRMSCTPKIMSSVTFTRQQMIQVMADTTIFHNEHQLYRQPDNCDSAYSDINMRESSLL